MTLYLREELCKTGPGVVLAYSNPDALHLPLFYWTIGAPGCPTPEYTKDFNGHLVVWLTSVEVDIPKIEHPDVKNWADGLNTWWIGKFADA